jgi:hypothetical protein
LPARHGAPVAAAALSPEPWRGASTVEGRLPAELQDELRAALPATPAPDEVRRALRAAVQQYDSLRLRLAAEAAMPLAEELAAHVGERLDRS